MSLRGEVVADVALAGVGELFVNGNGEGSHPARRCPKRCELGRCDVVETKRPHTDQAVEVKFVHALAQLGQLADDVLGVQAGPVAFAGVAGGQNPICAHLQLDAVRSQQFAHDPISGSEIQHAQRTHVAIVEMCSSDDDLRRLGRRPALQLALDDLLVEPGNRVTLSYSCRRIRSLRPSANVTTNASSPCV